jgi:hypothetical protein
VIGLPTLKACAAFLACVGANGVDPAYVHRLAVDPPEVRVDVDGVVTEGTMETLRYCSVVVRDRDLVCEYHPDPEHREP